MLVKLGLVEQRYEAVLEVLESAATVTDAARRYGVGRQTVHKWLRRYATSGPLVTSFTARITGSCGRCKTCGATA